MSLPPRSARELLVDYGLSEGVINGVLDIHAHELAEQQRAWIADRTDMPWWADEIPDVIDPAQSARQNAEVGARDRLWELLGIDPDRISREEFEQYMDAYDRPNAGPVRPGEEPTP